MLKPKTVSYIFTLVAFVVIVLIIDELICLFGLIFMLKLNSRNQKMFPTSNSVNTNLNTNQETAQRYFKPFIENSQPNISLIS